MSHYITALEEKAEEAEMTGDYLSALEHYLKASKAIQDTKKESDATSEGSSIFHRIANLYSETGNHESAIENYNKAIIAYKGSTKNITKILRKIAECYTKMGIILLANSNHKAAIESMDESMKSFDRAIEFVSEEELPHLAERYILNLLLQIICSFGLNKETEEIMPLLKKAVSMNTKYNAKGFMTDLSLFLLYVLNNDHSKSYKILKDKIFTVNDTLALGSIFHTIILCAIMDLALKYIPTIQVQADEAPNKDKGEVILTQKCFEEMLLYGLSFANRRMLKYDFREVLALIVGKVEKNKVFITEIVPMTSGTEKDVEFKEEHYAKAAEINAIAAERNEFIVGWYHTHPGLGLFLSPTDIINQLGYQSLNERAIALLFDFTQMTLSDSGFVIYRLIEPNFQSGYYLVPWRISDASKNFQFRCMSLINKFISTLNHFLTTHEAISITQLGKELDLSELLLEQIIPNLITLEYLPNAQFNSKTKMLSKK